jgi:4-hydroxybenzoate polyprenyltransferase
MDKIIWAFLMILIVIIMGILGWWNYIQTDYNKFILILILSGFLLILIIWRKGVNCQEEDKKEIFEAEE